MIDLHMLNDWQVLRLYREWSEDYWCAGFLGPDEGTVRSFIAWLRTEPTDDAEHVMEDYEIEMLVEYRKQVGRGTH